MRTTTSAGQLPAVSRCKITSYGLRIKLLMRGLDIYPDLLQTECTPLGEQP